MYKRIIFWHLFNLAFCVLYASINSMLLTFPDGDIFSHISYLTLVYLQLILYGLFWAITAVCLFRLSKHAKINWLAEVLLLDMPALLSVTYLKWHRFIFNMFDYEQSFIRSIIIDEGTFDVLLILGSLILGVEIMRYKEYFKKKLS